MTRADMISDALPVPAVPTAGNGDWPAGRGEARFEYIDGRTRITQSRAAAPLKLLAPTPPAHCNASSPDAAWLYATTFGGGLVAGDTIDLTITLGPAATAIVTTQASTKVYHQQQGLGAMQRLTAHIAPTATLIVTPDPLVCFEQAIYLQNQRFHLQPGGNLVLLDWFTAGRVAYGERWAFSRYASRNEILVDGHIVANDAMVLDPDDGPLTDVARLGRFDCVATLFILGERFEPQCDALVDAIQHTTIEADGELIVAASRTPWGAMFRAAGQTTSLVADELKRRLAFLTDALGVTPWDRKW